MGLVSLLFDSRNAILKEEFLETWYGTCYSFNAADFCVPIKRRVGETKFPRQRTLSLLSNKSNKGLIQER